MNFIPVILIVVVTLLVVSSIGLVSTRRNRRLSGGGIANGVRAVATVTSLAETGETIGTAATGLDAAVLRVGLRVQPANAAPAYDVEIKQAVPRVFMPRMASGAQLVVTVDPTNPQRVGINWEASGHMGATAGVAAAGASSVGTPGASAAQLLVTGTRSHATVVSASPLGITAAQAGATDPAVANDPVYLLELSLSQADGSVTPARFGHRVPAAKVPALAPGAVLVVAYDPADPANEVGIDWAVSPVTA